MTAENSVIVVRIDAGGKKIIHGAYSEETKDWNLLMFDATGRIVSGRNSIDIWTDIPDMLKEGS